jgi:pimeloyl-ACP methyl ester carboxylesterase
MGSSMGDAETTPPGVTLDWASGGYHPEWFRANRQVFRLLIALDAMELVVWFAYPEIDLFLRALWALLIITASWMLLAGIVNRITARWTPISAPGVIAKELQIHVGGDITLTGLEYLPAHVDPPYPVVITLHGYNSGRGQLNFINLALNQMGAAVLSYDLRGHGATAGDRNDVLFVLRDLNHTLEYIRSRSDLEASRVVVIGLSLGAIIALYEGYLDPRVRHVIGLATTSEYKTMIAENIKPLSKKWLWKLNQRIGGLEVDPSSLQSRLVSPALIANSRKTFFDTPVPWEIDNAQRVLLLQCADDYIVKPDNFQRNVRAFNMPPANVLLLKRGGHGFIGQEVAAVGKIIGWLRARNFFSRN